MPSSHTLAPARTPSAAPIPSGPSFRGRIASLDGLRGIAAIVVVFYHLTLVARPFLDSGRTGDAWWWITETPLKLFTAGTEAVLVFFVLSGFVVALPAFRAGVNWVGMLTGRMLRLYLPVWVSLVFAVVLLQLVPRTNASLIHGDWIIDGNAETPGLPLLAREATLMASSYDLNNVLWSLRWEIIFSLALPLLVGLATLVRKRRAFAVIGAIGLSVIGRATEIDALIYLPVFFLGTLAAASLDSLVGWAARRSRTGWVLLVTGSLWLLVASWLTRGIAPSGSPVNTILWGLASAGAAGLVVCAIASPAVSRLLESRIAVWLGKISFSLYLVHVPIIAAVTWALGDRLWWAVALVSAPLAVLAGWAFYLSIERPSHRLAKLVGSRAGALNRQDQSGQRRVSQQRD